MWHLHGRDAGERCSGSSKNVVIFSSYYAPLLQHGPLAVWHFPSSWGESSPPDNEAERSDKKVRNAGGPEKEGVSAWRMDGRTGRRGKKPTELREKSIYTIISLRILPLKFLFEFFFFWSNTWWWLCFKFNTFPPRSPCSLKRRGLLLIIITLMLHLFDVWCCFYVHLPKRERFSVLTLENQCTNLLFSSESDQIYWYHFNSVNM